MLTISPLDIKFFLDSDSVQNWLKPDGVPILWISGPCGVGKTSFVKRFSIYVRDLGIKTTWIHPNNISSIDSEIHKSTSCLIFDDLDFLPQAYDYLRNKIIPFLPVTVRMIVISRHRPFGLWLDPTWQKIINSVIIRPLGIDEAFNLVNHRISIDEFENIYVRTGGRYVFLDCLCSGEGIVKRFLKEAGAGKYIQQIIKASFLWDFDRKMIDKPGEPMSWQEWLEFTNLSFVLPGKKGFSIDPVLAENMIKLKHSGYDKSFSCCVKDRLTKANTGLFEHVMGFLRLNHFSSIEYLTNNSVEMKCTVQDHNFDLHFLKSYFNFRILNLSAKYDIKRYTYLFYDSSVNLAGFMILQKPVGTGPLVLKGVGFHKKLKKYVQARIIREILHAWINGEKLIVPIAFDCLSDSLYKIGFYKETYSLSIYKGSGLTCGFSDKDLIVWLEEICKGLVSGFDSSNMVLGDESMREVLKCFRDDHKLCKTKLGLLVANRLGENEEPAHIADIVRKAVYHGLERLPPKDKRLVVMAYLKNVNRAGIAAMLYVSERTLYRRLKEINRNLAGIILDEMEELL